MIRRPPISTRTDTLFPYTTLFRSAGSGVNPKAAAIHIALREAIDGIGEAPHFPHFLKEARGHAAAKHRRINLKGVIVRVIKSQPVERSEEHTSELQSLMRISYAVFCLKKKQIRRLVQTTQVK